METNTPIIAHIESSSSGFSDENPQSCALRYLFREDCGCQVIPYDDYYSFDKEFLSLKKYFDYGLLILIIVKQEKYSNEHLQAISKARLISNDLPIIVLSDMLEEETFKATDDKNLYVFSEYDSKLIHFVYSLALNWHPSNNWFSVLTQNDVNIVMHQLECAYKNNYLTEEDGQGAFGVSDYNHQIVTEAMRLRIFPAELLKSEFDNSIGQVEHIFIAVEPLLYQNDFKTIKLMNDNERREFENKLSRARGYEPSLTGGVFVSQISCGGNVSGFAIDANTFECLITNKYGQHWSAKSRLSRRVRAIYSLRKHCEGYEMSAEEEYQCNHGIVAGLILKISDFMTPILCLWQENVDDEHFKRVASFLIRRQQFIPVTPKGKLIVDL